MPRVCLFSDVHAELAATRSILSDAGGRGITRLWCLGDFASGGRQPAEVFDLVMARSELVLAGNHEHFAAADHLPLLAGGWAQAARFARAELGPQRIERLMGLPVHLSGSGIELVHASLTDELFGFINASTVAANFDSLLPDSRALLFGHTHQAALWEQSRTQPSSIRRRRVHLDQRMPLPEDSRVLINPGFGADSLGARWCELELGENGTPVAATWRRSAVR